MAGRRERHEAIRSILAERRIASQRELVSQLSERGFAVTQATLSRDLKELGVSKQPARGYRVEATAPDYGYLAAFQTMEFSGAFGLIRTLPGHAMSVAAVIDEMGLDVVLGTIAGDDTILVVPRDGITPAGLKRAFRKRLPEFRDAIG